MSVTSITNYFAEEKSAILIRMAMSTEEKVKKFFTSYKDKSFQEDTIIIHPDDEIKYIYYIEKGSIRQYAVSREGEEATLHIFHSCSYFPLMIILSQQKNTYFFEALKNTVIRTAPVSDVVKFLHKNPDVLFDLTVRFAKAIEGMLQKTKSLLHEHAYQKVISILLYLSKHETVNLPFSHENIASWIGLERETVSRQLKKLHKKRLIATKKNYIIIRNIEKLRKEIKTN